MKTIIGLSESASPERVELDIKLSGSQEFVARIAYHLKAIERLGQFGHSGTVGIDVDGDGSDRCTIKFDGWDKDMDKQLSSQVNKVGEGGDVEIYTPTSARMLHNGKVTLRWEPEK